MARLFIILILVAVSMGCAGTRTFHDLAQAGDTVAVGAGWKHTFSREYITVTITPTIGSPVVYPPGDAAIRAVTNLYPDPMSNIVLSRQINGDLSPYALTYARAIHENFTGDDKDWWQTVVFVDLPSTLPVGSATIDILSSAGETSSATFDIVSDGGLPNPLRAELNGPMSANQLVSLERHKYYHTVNFTGTTVPQAIQIDLTHDATVYPYVVNPIGYIKNVVWENDGSNLRVILLPARSGEITTMTDYKFYVARVINLNEASIQAFDNNGVPVGGVSVSITPSPALAEILP